MVGSPAPRQLQRDDPAKGIGLGGVVAVTRRPIVEGRIRIEEIVDVQRQLEPLKPEKTIGRPAQIGVGGQPGVDLRAARVPIVVDVVEAEPGRPCSPCPGDVGPKPQVDRI